ncbi:hypothetical protein B0A48_13580 [Cryoendolithus antarcticus]|uniref:Extracellular serine-rich protein n=1 Tax=Cryoendolithus antarcticus TaxID=1507870 RepID=A0A1V8SP18_9PEZI|nr:hypothetical protein B0A48_13580 [Cryoendolithus antarcticus]
MASLLCQMLAAIGLASSIASCQTSTTPVATTSTTSSTSVATTSAVVSSSTTPVVTTPTSSAATSAATTSSTVVISSSASSAPTSSSTDGTIVVSETVPAGTTVTGTTSAAPPPASATTDNAVTTAPASSAAPPVASATPAGNINVAQTILVLVRTADDPYAVISGLQGYGIPYQVVQVPQTGFTLPALNSSATQGNYGGIISLSELAYEYSTGWAAGISTDQYNQLYAYQTAFGVRFVRIDAYPQPAFGVSTAAQGVGCCGQDVEQLISISNATGFPGANIKTGATMSTKNMYHYPATITDPLTTWEVAKYAPDANGVFNTDTTAAVINNFAGRQQMVWFGSWATQWSPTSNFLQHAYIHWMTRGLFVGARKVYLSTQIDDVHLNSEIYYPGNTTYRINTNDLVNHVAWTKAINSRMPAGSNYFIELGHNGNGDIIEATAAANTACNPADAIFYDFPPDTPLEFQKPLGSGVNKWPSTPASYSWSIACAKRDSLANWFTTAANRDAFAHISHTFTHLPQNNITYSDANKEIVFNQAWLKQITISAGNKFSSKGLIPPAITGLHNGDALRAWVTNGITNAVGDNSRPVLLSPYNQHWPLISNVSANGYAGVTIVPRWPTTIYFNCDTPACTTQEWINTASGKGGFSDLLNFEKTTTMRYLFGLRHDGYMFHQANLRVADQPTSTIGSQTAKLSIFESWVETMVQELGRLSNWPLTSLKQDDLAAQFTSRMTRDNCKPSLSNTLSSDGKTITAVTVTATNNKCGTTIPVTLPGNAPSGYTADKVGSEPNIVWVSLTGSAVKLTLPTPVAL